MPVPYWMQLEFPIISRSDKEIVQKPAIFSQMINKTQIPVGGTRKLRVKTRNFPICEVGSEMP